MASIMKNYKDEHELSSLYQKEFNQGFEPLSREQTVHLRKLAKEWYNWSREHAVIHNTINIVLILSILALDFWVWRLNYFSELWANVLVIFLAHSYLSYSVSTFTIHEGSGHNMVIIGKSKLAKFGQLLANNVPRLFYNDPGFYGPIHIHHHKDFGTEQDAAFTNYVRGDRLIKCFLPLAAILPFCDYKIHAGTRPSKSQFISNIVGTVYGILLCRPFAQENGRLLCIGLILACAWLSFTLDRMRESTEHHLMPTDELNGARTFGLGFWGLTMAGGPWGQPSHMAHHVYPALPWYWQCRLHFEILKVLTEKQKKQFVFDKFMDYPRLVWQIFTERRKVQSRYQEMQAKQV